jgi:hypothetical protein
MGDNKISEAALPVVARYVGKTSNIYRYIAEDLAVVDAQIADEARLHGEAVPVGYRWRHSAGESWQYSDIPCGLEHEPLYRHPQPAELAEQQVGEVQGLDMADALALVDEEILSIRNTQEYARSEGNDHLADQYDEIHLPRWANLRAALAARQPGAQEPVEFDYPEFHAEGMGCGIEDRNITDRYEAMRYGFDEALDQMAAILDSLGPLYAAQPAQGVDLGQFGGYFEDGSAAGFRVVPDDATRAWLVCRGVQILGHGKSIMEALQDATRVDGQRDAAPGAE